MEHSAYMTNLPIYLDNHATTRVDPRVLDAMLPFFTERYGNAASINHAYGWDARDAVEIARQQVANLVHADPRGVVFTSGATEANNLAIKGVVLPALRAGLKPHVVTSVAEHRSVLEPLHRLTRMGLDVTWLPVDEYGQVRVEDCEQALRPETVLVSIMAANNEVGTLNSIAEIGAIFRHDKHNQRPRDVGHSVLFHSDAVQAVGKVPLSFAATNCDLMSVSAHKLYGPKGIGALIVRKGSKASRIEPLFDGGGHEGHLRSGTLAVPLIVGFGKACELALAESIEESNRLRSLRDQLWATLRQALPQLVLNGHPIERLPGNLNFSVPGVSGEVLMNSITKIAVSSGSACTSSDPEPSHVLRAMGRTDQLTRASLRVGLGRFTTAAEVQFAAQYLIEQISARCPAATRN